MTASGMAASQTSFLLLGGSAQKSKSNRDKQKERAKVRPIELLAFCSIRTASAGQTASHLPLLEAALRGMKIVPGGVKSNFFE
jgi:hypothetical protein